MSLRFHTALLLSSLIGAGILAQAAAAQLPALPSVADGALKAQAFWIDRSTILIPAAQVRPQAVYKLFSDPTAHIGLSTKTGLSGKYSTALQPADALTAEQIARFPQLAHGYAALKIPATVNEPAEHLLLTGQIEVSVQKPDGQLAYVTGVQTAGVLDDLYAYSGNLGVVVHTPGAQGDTDWADFPDDLKGAVKIKIWAPTAQAMSLQLFFTANQTTPSETVPMHRHGGVWVAVLDPMWIGHYYLLDEKVYSRAQLTVVENVVTDPYSYDISLNGTKSRILYINSPATKPSGWDSDRSPILQRLNDISIYELHIRDFSVADQTVPSDHRGTYLAFTDSSSDGMKHLQAVASAGMRYIHLLPSFHFSGVDEVKTNWKTTPDLTRNPPDGRQQQAAVSAIKESDSYNWGYGPIHFFTPEGAYAVHPDDRVREYRTMVMALHKTGLRVVQDVVFNHTAASGQDPLSILDKVVPGYYNRFDADGQPFTATCCADSASENLMFGKLQQDALLWNARHYKIDGFRFDLMGFTFVPNLQHMRTALDQLTVEKDGVDGSKIYLYGEGWEFGEISKNAYGMAATQLNLYGQGVGSFNDRMRDGIRGGTVSGDMRPQGFATGLFTDPAKYSGSPSIEAQRKTLLHQQDLIRVGLAGGLRDYRFNDSSGAATTGGKVEYSGKPAGYAASPIEIVNYASAHDNQILFDTIQIKSAASDDAATRARRQVLAMSLVALGQGVPFFVAGDDLLRSKDMDGNSYNSGDWFNKIDWTGQANNWGIGLPIAEHDSDWFVEKPLLERAALRPGPAEIAYTYTAFRELLKIRYSSGLFRMATLEEIQQNLSFPAVDVPGLIVMKLDAADAVYGPYRHILVLFNGTMSQQTWAAGTLKDISYTLHPIQQNATDPRVRSSTFNAGAFSVPPLTTAIFVSKD